MLNEIDSSTDEVNSILLKINLAFPYIEMPNSDVLTIHNNNCKTCEYLRTELERFRHGVVTDKALHCVHPEITCLSAKTFQWLLPEYLKLCVTADYESGGNTAVIELLIYTFSSELPSSQAEALEQLFELTKAQLVCFIFTLKHLLTRDYWKEYCPEDIERAIQLLQR